MRIVTFRLVVVVVVAFALAVAGCSSGDDGTSAGDDAPAGEPEPTDAPDAGEQPDGTDAADPAAEPTDEPAALAASAPGITEDTISLGVAIPDLTALTNGGDIVARYQAVADRVNDGGGLIGRRVELVVEQWDGIDTTGLDAACVALTEDVEVFAILTRVPSALGGAGCFSGLGRKLTISAQGVEADAIEAAEGRLLSTNADSFAGLLGGLPLLADDLAGARVAIAGSSEPGEEARVAALTDALEDLGAEVVATTFSTIAYTEDQTASLAEVDTFTQVWVSAGATHVLGINAGAIGAATAIDSNGLADDLTLISGTIGPRALTAVGADLGDLSIIGVSAPTRLEVGAAGLHGTPACLEILDDLGEVPDFDVEPGDINNVPSMLEACDAFDFLAAAFDETGPNPTEASFLAAIDAGFDFEMTTAGSARAGSDTPYLNRDPGEVFDWNGSEFVARSQGRASVG